MDIKKILQQRADEVAVCADELRGKVEAFQQTGDIGPVSDSIVLLTQLLMGLTGLGAVVEQKGQREQAEAAMERVHRMLDPQKRPLT